MNREYDIFENEGEQLIWRCSIIGLEAAVGKLKDMAASSPHEFKLMHLATNTAIATVHMKKKSQAELP